LVNFKEDKFYLWAILTVAVVFIVLLWLPRIFSETGRVRRFVLRGKKAVETKNILSCANMISRDYNDKYGNDRDSLIYIAREFFGYYRKIFVHIEDMKIVLDDSKMRASVEVVALVFGQTPEDTEERILEGEKGRFRIKLIKEDKVWKLRELEFFEPLKVMKRYIS
jgi:hypothetical protein